MTVSEGRGGEYKWITYSRLPPKETPLTTRSNQNINISVSGMNGYYAPLEGIGTCSSGMATITNFPPGASVLSSSDMEIPDATSAVH